MEKQDEARAIEMTAGTAGNLAEALDQWENEREMISQLHDENQAYTTALRRFDIVMALAGKVIDAVERDAAMFITEKTRKEIQQFREQVNKLKITPANVSRGRSGATSMLAQDVKENSTERKKARAKQTHTHP